MSTASEENRGLRDEARRRNNEKSKEWATRRHVAWSAEDDDVILNEWIKVPCAQRDEMGVARRLSRTLYACQGRAEDLRRALGLALPSSSRTAPPAPQPVCQRCFIELPCTGVCDNCD
jgi:hypothetical protein